MPAGDGTIEPDSPVTRLNRYTLRRPHPPLEALHPPVKLASRMDLIGTETAFEAAARARALEATGRDVIHLEIGEPDFDTPRHISEAAARGVLDEGMTHYTAATAVPPT